VSSILLPAQEQIPLNEISADKAIPISERHSITGESIERHQQVTLKMTLSLSGVSSRVSPSIQYFQAERPVFRFIQYFQAERPVFRFIQYFQAERPVFRFIQYFQAERPVFRFIQYFQAERPVFRFIQYFQAEQPVFGFIQYFQAEQPVFGFMQWRVCSKLLIMQPVNICATKQTVLCRH